jgi:hypothetical protein
MFKFESFFKKGQEDVKKAAKIGTLAVGIGAGTLLGVNKVEAQTSRINNQETVSDSTLFAKARKENELDRKWAASPERYDLSKKENVSGLKKERQTNPEKLLQYNIEEVKNALKTAKNRIFFEKGSWTEIAAPEGEALEEQEQEIKAYEEYLINPSLEIKSVGNVEFEQEDFQVNRNAFKFYDEQIEKIAEHLKSQEYLDKLVLEYGDEEAALEHQRVRIQNLYNGDYNLTDETPNFASNENTFEVSLSKNKSAAVANHEILGHKIVDGENFSKHAAKLLVLSYQKFNPESKYFKSLIKADNPKDFDDAVRILGNYFGKKSERFAFKEEFEMEMISSGIKKYGEKFTQESYQKLMDFYHQGKLSDDACRFIETTKPEYFEKIFNEIAENNLTPEDKVNRENKA